MWSVTVAHCLLSDLEIETMRLAVSTFHNVHIIFPSVFAFSMFEYPALSSSPSGENGKLKIKTLIKQEIVKGSNFKNSKYSAVLVHVRHLCQPPPLSPLQSTVQDAPDLEVHGQVTQGRGEAGQTLTASSRRQKSLRRRTT